MKENISPKPEKADKLRNEVFLRLLMAKRNQIYAFILTLIPNWADAEDIMQETTMTMWHKFDTFKLGTDFTAWGIRIAYYEFLIFRRKQHNKKLQFRSEIIDTIAKQVSVVFTEIDSRAELLQDCLDKLGRQDRQLLRMRYELGATTKSMAEKIGRPVQGLYKAMARIHNVLLHCVRRGLAAEEF